MSKANRVLYTPSEAIRDANIEEAKEAISDVLHRALKGDERYTMHNGYVRWMRVEEDLHTAVDRPFLGKSNEALIAEIECRGIQIVELSTDLSAATNEQLIGEMERRGFVFGDHSEAKEAQDESQQQEATNG